MSDSCSDSLNEAKLLRDASAMSDGSDVESEGPDFRREFVLTPFVRGLKLVAEQVVGAAAVVAARRGDTVTIKHGVTAKEFEEVVARAMAVLGGVSDEEAVERMMKWTGIALANVEADGDCFFHAVLWALASLKISIPEELKCAKKLRAAFTQQAQKIAKALESKVALLKAAGVPPTDEKLQRVSMRLKELNSLLQHLPNNGAFVYAETAHLVPSVLSAVVGTPVLVVEANGQSPRGMEVVVAGVDTLPTDAVSSDGVLRLPTARTLVLVLANSHFQVGVPTRSFELMAASSRELFKTARRAVGKT